MRYLERLKRGAATVAEQAWTVGSVVTGMMYVTENCVQKV